MAVASYPTPLDATSTNIDLVGGKDAFIGMQREDKNGNRYVLYKVISTVEDGKWVSADHTNRGLELPPSSQIPIVGANTTGKELTTGQYFWCMVYGTYHMFCSVNVSSAYKRLQAATGPGTFTGSDVLEGVESCGMSLEPRNTSITNRARCLIDPRSSYKL